MIDPYNLNFTFVSDACQTHTGFTKAEHIKLNLREILAPPHLAPVLYIIEETFEVYDRHKNQHETNIEIERYHKDGTTY
jgi:PAS domain S-box-containing protein